VRREGESEGHREVTSVSYSVFLYLSGWPRAVELESQIEGHGATDMRGQQVLIGLMLSCESAEGGAPAGGPPHLCVFGSTVLIFPKLNRPTLELSTGDQKSSHL
jgi:hypothetical protein